ncbi:MAG: PAS domain-containing protein, partial [Rhodoferax sp.]
MSLSGHFSYSYALAIGDELAMFRAMLDHLPVGITVFDREFRLSMVNRLAIDMLDFPVSM